MANLCVMVAHLRRCTRLFRPFSFRFFFQYIHPLVIWTAPPMHDKQHTKHTRNHSRTMIPRNSSSLSSDLHPAAPVRLVLSHHPGFGKGHSLDYCPRLVTFIGVFGSSKVHGFVAKTEKQILIGRRQQLRTEHRDLSCVSLVTGMTCSFGNLHVFLTAISMAFPALQDLF